MANHLDLEEQEQLDQLKHFWKQYGNLITWSMILVLGAFASWNFYQYWQRTQSSQAAALFDEVDRAVQSADAVKIDRVFGDMKTKYASTLYAQQAGLLVAKQYYAAGSIDSSKSALIWVADQAADPGYTALAKLRLAGLLLETKAFDEALKLLNGSFPSGFDALVADRKGDVYLMQGKKTEAILEYQRAFTNFEENTEYRRLVEVKLNSLGIDPQSQKSLGKLAVQTTGANEPVAKASTTEVGK